MTLNRQFSPSKSEDMESKNASMRDNDLDSIDASDDDSLIVYFDDLVTPSLEDENENKSDSEYIKMLQDWTTTPVRDNESSKTDMSSIPHLPGQSEPANTLQHIVYPVQRWDGNGRKEQRLDIAANLNLSSSEKEYQLEPIIYPVQRWDGAEQKEHHQEAEIKKVSTAEENYYAPIAYPSHQSYSVKQDVPRRKEAEKMNKFSDVKKRCNPANTRPTSKLQRSQSVRSPKQSGSLSISRFRDSMDLSPIRHKATGRKPCDNTLCEYKDMVYSTTTKDDDMIRAERAFMDSKEPIQQSKLEKKTSEENVEKCDPFDAYNQAEEKKYGSLQRTKTIAGNLNLITQEFSSQNQHSKIAEFQNQSYRTDKEKSVYSQPRSARIPEYTPYRSCSDQNTSVPFSETGLSTSPYVPEHRNENAFSHVCAQNHQEVSKSRPAEAHSRKQENRMTSVNPMVITTSKPAQPYSQLSQEMSPCSQLKQAVSPYSQIKQAVCPCSQLKQAVYPHSQLKQAVCLCSQLKQAVSPHPQLKQAVSPHSQIKQAVSPCYQVNQEMSTPSRMSFAGQVTSQPRGLQRSFSMRENKTSRAPDKFAPKVTEGDWASHHPTSSARQNVISAMKKSATKKTTSPSYLDSDVQPGSGNSPNIDGRVSVAQQHFSRKTNRSQKTKMEVPRNNIGVWEFGKENFLTSVPEVWPVFDCIAHVRNKIGKHGYGDLDLWVKNRCIMLDKKKSLSDYPGLKSLHVVRRPSSRNPHPSHQTSRADDTDPFSDDTCVGMYCGHAISPDNLYNYAWQKIQNGATEVTCPAVPDVNKPGEQCSKVWEFKSISLLACLSDDENYLFCDRLFLNWLEKQADVYLCPVCNEAIGSSCTNVFKCFNCEKAGKSHSFCVKCNRVAYSNFCFNSECQESLPKIRALLRDCQMRTLIGVPNCPSVRACPVCNCVIEFDEEDLCKHMTCPRNTCQAKFCFICLKVKTDKYYYPCGGAFEPCQPAPRQCI